MYVDIIFSPATTGIHMISHCPVCVLYYPGLLKRQSWTQSTLINIKMVMNGWIMSKDDDVLLFWQKGIEEKCIWGGVLHLKGQGPVWVQSEEEVPGGSK